VALDPHADDWLNNPFVGHDREPFFPFHWALTE
jgi:hypothetical protein